ncbi:MAG: beta-lactamase family protein [Clostridiales bacterium]|nr:beta-lactamase family protein [Candidatus Blautia equi]
MLTERINKIREVMQEMVDTQFVSGVNCMVIQNGVEQFYHETGVRDIETGEPVTRDTIFRLYSLTKTITSAAVMMLLEDGKLDLLDPVSKFLPGFKKQHLQKDGRCYPPEKEITIQMLLNMTSGIPYPGNNDPAEVAADKMMQEIIQKMGTDEALSTVEIANRTGEQPLCFEPGATWKYGFSADILGAVVEVVSDMRFGDFLKRRIFEPLGMDDTAFFVPEEKQYRLAKVYRDTPNGLELYTEPHLGVQNEMKYDPAFESGGAGLVSTIEDIARFAQMLMNGGTLDGAVILSPATVKFMTSGQLSDIQQKGVDQWDGLAGHSYANFMRVVKDPEKAVTLSSKGEYGWDGWLGVYMTNDPAHDLTMIMMQQRVDSGTTGYTRKIRNVLFSSLTEE